MDHSARAVAPGQDPARPCLWWLGSLSLLAYSAVLALSFRFRYGEDYAQRPILAVLALLAAATVCYLLALWYVSRRPAQARDGAQGKLTPEARHLRLILGFSAAYRLLLLPSVPIQEIDYYRYLWDGRVTATGLNPYHFSPKQVELWGPAASSASDLFALSRLSDQSPAVATIFQRVHHREVPTIYPPVAQVVFAAGALVTPAAAPLWVHLLVLKLLLVSFDLATLLLLVALLRRLHLPATWCLAYGWCPLAVKEFANSGHLDSIAVCFTLLSLFLLVACARGSTNHGRATITHASTAAAALGLAVLAKSYPIILAPVAAAYLAARLRFRALLPLGVFLAVIVLGYLPFCGFPRRPQETDAQAPGRMLPYSALPVPRDAGVPPPEPRQPWTGLGTFLTHWEMNDFLFMLVHENLRRPEEQPQRWFVILPGSWREALHRGLLNPLQAPLGLAADIEPAFLLTHALTGLLLGSLCLYWAWQGFRQPVPQVLLHNAFLTLAWGWLLSSTPNPWYLLWCLPFMIFAGRRSWFLLPGLALAYYLRFWLEYHAPGSEAGLSAARATFDFGLVWVEYLPFFLALLAEILQRHPFPAAPRVAC